MPDFHIDAPIFGKTYDFYKLFYSYLPDFPKGQRYTLGLKCDNAILNILEGIIIASQHSRQHKVDVLKDVSIKLDVLKILCRLAYDTKAIDKEKYLILEERIQEIGRMLGGWIKSLQ